MSRRPAPAPAVRPCFICGSVRECHHREQDNRGLIEPTLRTRAERHAAALAIRRAVYLLDRGRLETLREEMLTDAKFRDAVKANLQAISQEVARLADDIDEEIEERKATPPAPSPETKIAAVGYALLEGAGTAGELAVELGHTPKFIAGHLSQMIRRKWAKKIGTLHAEDSVTGFPGAIYELTEYGRRQIELRLFLRPRYHVQEQARGR